MAFRERKEVKGGLFGMASLPIAICAVLVLPCAQVLSINKSWNGVLGRILSVCVVFPFPCNACIHGTDEGTFERVRVSKIHTYTQKYMYVLYRHELNKRSADAE
jgi:Na+/melibiose symporter-like transporter